MPWVIRLPMPAITNDIASVAISALILKYVATIPPLIEPDEQADQDPDQDRRTRPPCCAGELARGHRRAP